LSPFFSIVLPTYNRAAMARTALKTVLWQTDGDWECLVVDDGSTDQTAEALAEFSKDARVRMIRNERNLGMNASRNRAIELAQGRFVTFLDSDDLWLPERLAAFRRRSERSPEAGFLFSNAWVWRYDRVIGPLFDPARDIPEGRVPGYYALGDKFLPYVTTNVAVAREAFGRLGLFKTEMRTLDTELFTRFLAAGVPVAALKEPLSVRRLHESQLTGRHEENYREALAAIEASGASEEIKQEVRDRAAFEVSMYLVKGGQPAQAREFLRRHLGQRAKQAPAYLWSALPAPVLEALRRGRKAWLIAGSALRGGAQARQVQALVRPLLREEEAAS